MLFIPPDCVWRNEATDVRFELRKQDLRRSAFLDVDHNWAKAKAMWTKGDYRLSKKNILHTLRWLHWGLQLLQRREIFDLQETNKYWPEVQTQTVIFKSNHSLVTS